MQTRSRPHRDATINFDTPRENTHVLQVNRQHYGLQVEFAFDDYLSRLQEQNVIFLFGFVGIKLSLSVYESHRT